MAVGRCSVEWTGQTPRFNINPSMSEDNQIEYRELHTLLDVPLLAIRAAFSRLSVRPSVHDLDLNVVD